MKNCKGLFHSAYNNLLVIARNEVTKQSQGYQKEITAGLLRFARNDSI
jgi:hypothetical protein